MPSNPDQIVQQMQSDFQSLIAYVRDAEARTRTAAEVECTLFRRLLALGLQLLRLFFLTRAAAQPSTPPTTKAGTPIPAHDRRLIDYVSVFGKLSFARQYFYASDSAGVCRLDAELSLPKPVTPTSCATGWPMTPATAPIAKPPPAWSVSWDWT